MSNRVAALFARICAPEDPPPWTPLEVANTVSILLISIFLVGSLVAYLIIGTTPLAILVGWVIGCVLSVVYDWYFPAKEPQRRASLRLNMPFGSSLPLLLLFGIGAAIVIDLIGRAVTGVFVLTPELSNAREFGLIEWVLALVLMVGAQPIAEEIVFRGVLLPKARVWMGVWGGILFCSIAYGLFHFLVYPPPTQDATMYWFAFMTPFLASVFLCLVRVYTGSTRAAILVHAAFGLFAVLRAFVLVG